MKKISICLGSLAFLSLVSCTRYVYRDVVVDKPITIPCHVPTVSLVRLPTAQEIPKGISQRVGVRKMLTQAYQDIVLLEGEVKALVLANKACK